MAMVLLRFGCALIVAAVTCASYGARAEVTRIEIASRTDVLGGNPFGAAGAYEKIVGKVFFSVDPAHPRNKAVVDLDKAPRDADGRVTFSADLYVLAPKDAARGNGVALFDVLNRGRKNILRDFNRAPAVPDPTAEGGFGARFLMPPVYAGVGGVAVRYSTPWRIDGARCAARARSGKADHRTGIDYIHAKHGRRDLRARRHGALCRYDPLSAARSWQPGEHAHRARWLSRRAAHHCARPVAGRPPAGPPLGARYFRALSQGRLRARPFL